MMLKYYLSKALAHPPRILAKKAARHLAGKADDARRKRRDLKYDTHIHESAPGIGRPHTPLLALDPAGLDLEAMGFIFRMYLEHRFDLLGSGWVPTGYGSLPLGLEGYKYSMNLDVRAFDCEGLWLKECVGPANLVESRRIWRLIAPCGLELKASSANGWMYSPVDWQKDYKSGYRWSALTWYKDIKHGHKPGADIKVPLELARMQHLPQLAFAYSLAAQSKEDGPETEDQKSINDKLEQPERYVWEFRSQVLDFIAANPPRFGVNWSCTMDVGIRVANWLAAYDLFCAYGAAFDRAFLEVFNRSVYAHGFHIANNLEESSNFRSNHYLSNIAGMLFAAVHLPRSPEIDAWLAFAVQELINEVESQFYTDGGNFEASTSYHRLSAEMVVFATALVLGLPENKSSAIKRYDCKRIKGKPPLKPAPLALYPLSVKTKFKGCSTCQSPFPEWYFERLEKMAEFTMHITKPDNHIPQIGDNDSGRFFKFQPVFNKMTEAQAKKRYLNLEDHDGFPADALYWDEDFLDHRHLVAAINGLFDRDDFTAFAGDEYLETTIIKNIAGGITLSSYNKNNAPTTAEKVRIESDNRWDELYGKLEAMLEDQKRAIDIPLPDGATDGLKLYAYPDFGLYVYRSKRLYLAIRCGSIGQNGNGGHAHNDQLSIELHIDRKDIICDPGTYLYTPMPSRRNEYRSVTAHYAPQLRGLEPGNLKSGLFCLGNDAKGSCLCFGEDGFIGMHYGYGFPISRAIMVLENTIRITDFTPENVRLEPIRQLNPEQPSTTPFSPGYGLRLA